MQRNLLKSSTDKIRKCQGEAVEKFFKFKKKIFVIKHA